MSLKLNAITFMEHDKQFFHDLYDETNGYVKMYAGKKSDCIYRQADDLRRPGQAEKCVNRKELVRVYNNIHQPWNIYSSACTFQKPGNGSRANVNTVSALLVSIEMDEPGEHKDFLPVESIAYWNGPVKKALVMAGLPEPTDVLFSKGLTLVY